MTKEKQIGIIRGRLTWVTRALSVVSIRPAVVAVRERTAVAISSLLAQSQYNLLIVPLRVGAQGT